MSTAPHNTCPHPQHVNEVCPICTAVAEDVGTVGDAVVVATYQRQPVADRLNPGVIVEGPMTDSFMCDTCKGWFSERHGARVPHVQLFGEADCRCDEPKKIITPPVRIDSVTWSHGAEDAVELRDGAVVFPDGKVLRAEGGALHLLPPTTTTSAEQEARAKFHDAAKPSGVLMGMAWSKTTQIPATPAASFAELAGETTDPRMALPTSSTAYRCTCGGWFAIDGGKRVDVVDAEEIAATRTLSRLPIVLCECLTPKPSATGERRPNGPPSVASRAEAKGPHRVVHVDYVEQLQAEITDLKGLLAMAKIREAEAAKDKAAVIAAVDDVVVMMSLPERDKTRAFSYPAATYVRHVLGELVKVTKGVAFDLAIANNGTRPAAAVRERLKQLGVDGGAVGGIIDIDAPFPDGADASMISVSAAVVEMPNRILGTIHVAAIAPLVITRKTMTRLFNENRVKDVDGVIHYVDDRGVFWPLFVG